jgi:hypothetical protein
MVLDKIASPLIDGRRRGIDSFVSPLHFGPEKRHYHGVLCAPLENPLSILIFK